MHFVQVREKLFMKFNNNHWYICCPIISGNSKVYSTFQRASRKSAPFHPLSILSTEMPQPQPRHRCGQVWYWALPPPEGFLVGPYRQGPVRFRRGTPGHRIHMKPEAQQILCLTLDLQQLWQESLLHMSGGKPLRLADSTAGRPSGMMPGWSGNIGDTEKMRTWWAMFVIFVSCSHSMTLTSHAGKLMITSRPIKG